MMNETIAGRLVKARGTRSRKEVAEDLGISIRSVIAYEQGKRVPRDNMKKILAEYFGKTVQELFY